MTGQVDQGSVKTMPTLVALPGDSRSHMIVKQFARCAVERLEGRHVAEHRREILMHDEASPDRAVDVLMPE